MIMQFLLHLFLTILKDSFTEQEQVNYLLEYIKRAEKEKQKEINPKDLILDFSDVNTSKLSVSNKSISKKPAAHKISEEYGIASSSKSRNNSEDLIILDS